MKFRLVEDYEIKLKENVNTEPLKVYREDQLFDKCWDSDTTPNIILARSIYYDNIDSVKDDISGLSHGTVNDDEPDKFLSIFRNRGGELYVPVGTYLTYVTSDRYYRYYRVNDSDIEVGFLRY